MSGRGNWSGWRTKENTFYRSRGRNLHPCLHWDSQAPYWKSTREGRARLMRSQQKRSHKANIVKVNIWKTKKKKCRSKSKNTTPPTKLSSKKCTARNVHPTNLMRELLILHRSNQKSKRNRSAQNRKTNFLKFRFLHFTALVRPTNKRKNCRKCSRYRKARMSGRKSLRKRYFWRRWWRKFQKDGSMGRVGKVIDLKWDFICASRKMRN